MDGLEAVELKLSEVLEVETFRLDSDYVQKKYLAILETISTKRNLFKTFGDLNIKVDASAFYPSLEPFYNQGKIPFLRVADVDTHIDYENCVKIPQVVLDDPSFKTLNVITKGDIVITKGGSIARVGLIEQDTAVTRDLIFLNSSTLNEINYKFLFLYLLSNISYDLLVRSSSMTAQPHLTIGLVRNLPIFNPESSFKKKVVDIFDLSNNKLEKSKTLYKQAEELLLKELNLLDFKPSVENITIKSFKDSFGTSGRIDSEYYQPKYDEVEAKIKANGFELVENICSHINYGTVPTSPYVEQGIPYIKGLNLKNISIDTNKLDFIENTEDLQKKFYTKENDIIISQMGTVGNVGVVSESQENWLFASFTIRIRLKDTKKFKPYVVAMYIQNIAKEWYLMKNIAQASVRQNTDLPTIKNMYIPIIDISIQNQIEEKIKKSFELKEESKKLLDLAKKAVEIAIEENEDEAKEFINAQI